MHHKAIELLICLAQVMILCNVQMHEQYYCSKCTQGKCHTKPWKQQLVATFPLGCRTAFSLCAPNPLQPAERQLQLAPTRRLPNRGAPLPRVGAVNWSGGEGTEEEQKTLEAAMYRLREQVAQRRVLTKPCFQDFDRCVCGGGGGTDHIEGALTTNILQAKLHQGSILQYGEETACLSVQCSL